MSEPPTSDWCTASEPPFIGVESPECVGSDRPNPAIFSGVMNPAGGAKAPLKSRRVSASCVRVAFNIENRFIGFIRGITSRRSGAVFSGVPPVHAGYTPFTQGFTGGGPPVAGAATVATVVMTAVPSGATGRPLARRCKI
jgi:hypothetical protein